MIICYCAKCGEVIPDRQLERGEAAYHDQAHYCKRCGTELGLTPMPPRAQDGTTARHVPAATGGAKPARVSSARLPTAPRPASAAREQTAGRSARPSGVHPTSSASQTAASQTATSPSASQPRLRRLSSAQMPAARSSQPTILAIAGGAMLLVPAVVATQGSDPAPDLAPRPGAGSETRPGSDTRPPEPRPGVDRQTSHALETELIALETVLARLEEPTEAISLEIDALARRTAGTPLEARGAALATRARAATQAARTRALEALRARSAELTKHYQFAQADQLWETERLPAALRGAPWAEAVKAERAAVAQARIKAFDQYPRGDIPEEGRLVDLLRGKAAAGWRSTGPAPEIKDGTMVLRSAKQQYAVATIDGDRLFKDVHLRMNLHLPSGAMRLAVRLLDDASIRAGHTPAVIALAFDEAWERPYWWRVHCTIRDGASAFWVEDRLAETPMGSYAATEGAIAFIVQPGDEVHIADLVVRVLAEGRQVPPPKMPEPGGQ